MILVTTAGKVGAEAARLLAQEGTPARVLVRNPEKASTLARAGVDVVAGDLNDRDSIDAAVRDVSAVILVSPAIPAQEIAVIDSAARAGVPHVVKVTSKASADSLIARRRGQAEIEARLIASGLGYTMLRNNAYMQNLLLLGPAVRAASGFGSAAGDGRIGMIDSRDVAAVAAAVAASPATHAGRTYWPTGPASISYAEAAEELSRVLGRTITYRPLTFEEQRQDMVDVGVPEHIAAMNAQAITLFAQGDSDWVTDDVPAILGRPARTFHRFLTDHLAAFT
ncbi:NmrA family NAD(P)-binding protein [Actinoplanes sp. NPDC000266]